MFFLQRLVCRAFGHHAQWVTTGINSKAPKEVRRGSDELTE